MTVPHFLLQNSLPIRAETSPVMFDPWCVGCGNRIEQGDLEVDWCWIYNTHTDQLGRWCCAREKRVQLNVCFVSLHTFHLCWGQ